MTDAAWELEKGVVIDWTATGDGSPSFGNYGFPECIRRSGMMDATTSIIVNGRNDERHLRGKDFDSIPIRFNGIKLVVWEKKNPDRREGGTIELVSRCGMDERRGELFTCDDEASQE
ncbi:hypothetical protein BPAE_0001g00590 [Botrytis paeoniae]|uniref:Uncharacterized protein n=1 Tax=Botrytis paeoniae TaxID=278948 RepID=A0A4Z1G2N5_9HELO|nr:hypothetical protein BPAE_0001g00590 [Botrytis paeoniae]